MSAAAAAARRTCLPARAAGVLLHPTALANGAETGVLEDRALDFLDALAEAGVRVWQMLPIHPVHVDRSPYLPPSLFAIGEHLQPCLRQRARDSLAEGLAQDSDYQAFCRSSASWLEPWSAFRLLREAHGREAWPRWPEPWRDASLACGRLAESEAEAMAGERALQYLLQQRWQRLRHAAAARGIALFGDLPMFPSHDSAEVWAEPGLFHLDAEGWPTEAAGAPPDAFASTGQYWGGAVYNWPALAAQRYAWWIRRLQRQSELFDLLRLDHFRGFEAYWSIPAGASDAAAGRYLPGPGIELFRRLSEQPNLAPLVAEDLGMITAEVEALRRAVGIPGIRVFQFGFDGSPDNPHLPARVGEDCVYYSGTHDNDTTLGWWRGLDVHTQALVRNATMGQGEPMPVPALQAVLASRARLAVLSMQDVLGLGTDARFNTPGTAHGNWRWRMPQGMFDAACRSRLHAWLAASGRA